MVKTRSSNGQFTSPSKSKDEISILDTPINLPVTKNTIMLVAKLLLLVIIISPWLMLAFRKQNIDTISKKITDFYDDNFSCNSICDYPRNKTASRDEKKNLIDF